jgi:hypothetical protein
MKKILLSISALVLTGMMSLAAPVERIYLSTDRSVYLAGDAVWCSLTCLDQDGRFSNASAISYIELVSAEGTACTAKIGLLEGRGAGSFRIPVTTPTGTYRLLAYTAVNAAEEGQPWLAGSRLVTVYNSTSAARVPGGVEIGKNTPEIKEIAPEGKVELSTRIRIPKGQASVLNIHNGGSAASVSLSVFHEDDLPRGDREMTPAGFLKALPNTVKLTRDVSVENDGEIVSARIRGTILTGDDISVSTLSAAGSPTDLYIGRSDGGEHVRYYTSNIYGNREIVCEVSQLDRKEGYIDFESPFLFPDVGPLPKIFLNADQRPDIVARKAALRAEKALRIDTLTTFMTHREDLLLASVPSHRYHLDDYTRFPSVKEILVEIIPELRLRTDHGVPSILLTYTDVLHRRNELTHNIVVMMDGVVLSDLNLLLNFDAMLIDDIDIYDQAFVCGKTPLHGLVNFITKKNYVTALNFPANVRVVDFQGVAYPVAYSGVVPEGEGQDLRQLLYWHPILKLDAASDYRLEFTAPGYAGRFKAVAEGFTEDGTPIYQEFTFEVE